MTDEAGNILLLHHAVFQQLRAADDALQRRFELVRHVRREFAARLLRRFALGDVEGQQHRADRRAACADTADVKLPDAAAALHARLAVPLVHGALDGKAHVVAAVDRQKVLPDAAPVRAEELFRRGVDAQHMLLFVEQHESFSHATCDLRKFRLLALQLVHLLADLQMLAVDAPEQRGKLFVGVVFKRMLQIELVERLDDTARQALGKNAGKDQRHNQHDQNGLHHADEQYARRRAAHRNAQHAPVRELFRAVHRLLQQRRGIARAFALAVFQRLLDLRAVGVIFKALGVGHGVVEHRAVVFDPRQAVALGGELREIPRPIFLHSHGGKLQLVVQLLFFNAPEVFVQTAHDDEQARQQHRTRHEQDGVKDFLGHALPSIR